MRENSILYTPYNIGSIQIPNRFVRSATHDYMSTNSGSITERQLLLFEALAKGEVGLIITGHAYINTIGKASPYQIGIYEDSLINGMKQITQVVHQYSSRIFIQVAHAGRQTTKKICGSIPLSPSALYEPIFKVKPIEMTAKDIKSVITGFIQGAKRAKLAGFDGVQLHAAHGYLLSSFISPYTNRRSDEWGGTISNRLRIIIEITRGIKELLGGKFPLIVKLNSSDLLPTGLEIEESIEIAGLLEQEGIDAIEVSGGMAEAGKGSVWKGLRPEEKEGYFVENAAKIKASVSIPVFGLGGIRSIKVMEKIIKDRKADFISMSRPFIREPYLVKKLRVEEIDRSECISCNKCFNLRGIKCSELEKKFNSVSSGQD
ncbi:NADH:flavin oxidoreductase [Acidobacteriota bacterium]